MGLDINNRSDWVALVSQSLAETLYPGENPVGKFLEGISGTRIVGVVADIRARSLLERPMPAYYWPRALQTTNQLWLMVRTGMAAQQLAADLRQIVGDVYPERRWVHRRGSNCTSWSGTSSPLWSAGSASRSERCTCCSRSSRHSCSRLPDSI
jgi:hypothetical protein